MQNNNAYFKYITIIQLYTLIKCVSSCVSSVMSINIYKYKSNHLLYGSGIFLSASFGQCFSKYSLLFFFLFLGEGELIKCLKIKEKIGFMPKKKIKTIGEKNNFKFHISTSNTELITIPYSTAFHEML